MDYSCLRKPSSQESTSAKVVETGASNMVLRKEMRKHPPARAGTRAGRMRDAEAGRMITKGVRRTGKIMPSQILITSFVREFIGFRWDCPKRNVFNAMGEEMECDKV